jgi:hypothetical protein
MHTEIGTRVHHRHRDVERVERRFKGGGQSPWQTYQMAQMLQQQTKQPDVAPVPIVPPTYSDPVSGRAFTNTGDLNAAIDTREADARTAQANKDAADLATKNQARTDFTTRSTNARTNAENAIRAYFTNQGLDPNKYWGSDIAPALNTEANSIQDLDPNPQAAYAPNLGAQIIGDLTSGRRTQATNQINSQFGPTYTADRLPYTLDDAPIETLLSGQYDPLSLQLTNAQKRGTLNDTGYQAALKQMETEKTGGRSTLSTLGTGIIDTDRGKLNDYITGAKSDASGLSLANADTFDPGAYSREADSRVNTYTNALPGDLTNALGSTKFSDLSSLLNVGGSVQTAYDPTAANPNSAGGQPSPQYIADQVLASTKRGIGSTGAF